MVALGVPRQNLSIEALLGVRTLPIVNEVSLEIRECVCHLVCYFEVYGRSIRRMMTVAGEYLDTAEITPGCLSILAAGHNIERRRNIQLANLT